MRSDGAERVNVLLEKESIEEKKLPVLRSKPSPQRALV
jgi:hypothetical protein